VHPYLQPTHQSASQFITAHHITAQLISHTIIHCLAGIQLYIHAVKYIQAGRVTIMQTYIERHSGQTWQTNIHAYIHTHIHTHKHTYNQAYIYTYIHTYTHIPCIHTYKHTYTYIHAYMHPSIHPYIQTYRHTGMHTNTHIHTYIHTVSLTD